VGARDRQLEVVGRGLGSRERPPAVEHRTRREAIHVLRIRQRAALRGVAAVVEEHVRERVADLPRRPQDVGVVAVGQHGSAPAHHPVEAKGDAARERLRAARERPHVVRLGDEVQVVTLDGEVDGAEVGPAGHPA